MKKIILALAFASFVVSCKKIQAGSNKGVIKMEEGAERYSDDQLHGEPMGSKLPEAKHEKDSAKSTGLPIATVKSDAAKVENPTAAH
jgi:hypothetical protein